MKLEIDEITFEQAGKKMGQHNLMRATNQVPNIPLLRKQVEWAEAEEARRAHEPAAKVDHHWDQGSWFVALDRDTEQGICKTAACIAGNVGVLLAAAICYSRDDQEYWGVRDQHGNYWDWREFAKEKLGLIDSEAQMFVGSNDASEIRTWAEVAAMRVGEKL